MKIKEIKNATVKVRNNFIAVSALYFSKSLYACPYQAQIVVNSKQAMNFGDKDDVEIYINNELIMSGYVMKVNVKLTSFVNSYTVIILSKSFLLANSDIMNPKSPDKQKVDDIIKYFCDELGLKFDKSSIVKQAQNLNNFYKNNGIVASQVSHVSSNSIDDVVKSRYMPSNVTETPIKSPGYQTVINLLQGMSMSLIELPDGTISAFGTAYNSQNVLHLKLNENLSSVEYTKDYSKLYTHYYPYQQYTKEGVVDLNRITDTTKDEKGKFRTRQDIKYNKAFPVGTVDEKVAISLTQTQIQKQHKKRSFEVVIPFSTAIANNNSLLDIGYNIGITLDFTDDIIEDDFIIDYIEYRFDDKVATVRMNLTSLQTLFTDKTFETAQST